MKLTNKWKITGAIVGLVFLSAAGISVAASYKEKAFDPGAYEERDRKDNQILFPGEDISLGDDEQENDSELWQQDQNADENKKPENRPSSSVLFQTMLVADDAAQNDDMPQDDQQSPQNDVIYTPGSQDDPKTPSAHKKEDPKTDHDQPQIRPAKNPSGGNGGKEDGKKDPDKNNGGNNQKPGTPDTPDTPVNPAPDTPSSDQTDPSDNNKNDHTDDKGNSDDKGNTETPDKPSHQDPDTTTPTMPKDDTIIDADPYPGDDKLDIKDEEDYKRYSLKIIGLRDIDDIINSFYMGEYLNDQRVLYSVIVYVCEDGVPKYRLTELGDNFKLGNYPEQVTKDKVPLTFYFRPGEGYDWIEGTYNEEVLYSAKLLLKDLDNQNIYKQILVPKEKPQIALTSYYYDVAGNGLPGFGMEDDPISRLFLGWSETENGKSAGPLYTVEKTGAQVLYALPTVEVPASMKAGWEYAFFYLGNTSYYTRIQVLTAAKAVDGVLTIPEGIQALDLTYEFDPVTWLPSYFTCDTMKIPDSLLFLSTTNTGESQEDDYTFDVTRSYETGENNMYYAAEDGILYNREKTQILSIPDTMEKLTVGEQTESVHLADGNAIKEIHFTAAKPAAVSFKTVNDAKIYVPAGYYLKYLSAWGKTPGGNNQLLAESSDIEDFTEDDGAIYSADGKTLLAVKNSVSGVYVVREGVEKIAEDALENCGSIDLLLLPGSLKELEHKSLSENAPQKILFLGLTPPAIQEDSFSAASLIQVETAAKEEYDKTFAKLLPDGAQMISRIFSYSKKDDGYSYLAEEEDENYQADALLLSVPSDITVFTEQSLPDVNLTEIGPGVFTRCADLETVELPAGLTKIGEGAFRGCGSLQAFLSHEPDYLEIGYGAFDDTPAFRFAAFDAMYLNSYAYYGMAGWYGNCNGTGTVNIDRFSPSYYMVDMAGGKLLYGVGTDAEGNPADNCYVLGATDDITGVVHLEDNATEIAGYVFRNCADPFTVEGLDHLIAIGDYAFESSGIQGDITMNGGMVYLGSSAFRYCSGLTGVTLDGTGFNNGVYQQPFGLYAFEYCNNLTKVEITGSGSYDIGSEAFAGCTGLQEIRIAESAGIQKIGYSAFASTPITSITLPQTVNEICYGAFDMCDNLEKICLLSQTPPILGNYSIGMPFTFGDLRVTDGYITVPDGSGQDYIDVWKYYMLGYAPEYGDDLTEDQLTESENLVRKMLGLPEKEEKDPGISENDIDANTGRNGNTDDLPVTVSENATEQIIQEDRS